MTTRQASGTCDVVSKSVEETRRLGEQLGALLRPGDVLGLVGELGSGKTTFVQGLAKGMGLDPGVVKSPTFVLLREYRGRVPLVHVDSYRLDDAQQAMWLDLDWLFSPKQVTVIEWADRLATVLPPDYVELRFAHKTTQHRTISALAHGSRAQELLTQLVNRPQSIVDR